MKCTLKIAMDNAAFSDAPGRELARILRDAADRAEDLCDASQVRHGPWEVPLRDYNGNRVGDMVVRKS